MARVVFLQLNYYELHGPQSMAAVLEKAGHQTLLIVPGLEKKPLETIKKYDPLIVGIGHTTMERDDALIWARAIKERIGCKVVLGGVDPTFHPGLVENDSVDFVCRGESEYTFLELVSALESGQGHEGIEGISYSRRGETVANPMRGLIPDLDGLPFPKKDLYLARYKYYRDYPIKFFVASRGCPHNCTYCANKKLRSLYPDPRLYVRFKSPEYLIEEIKRATFGYKARTIGFNDDLFTYDEKWLARFLPLYKKEVGMPYFCCARIDSMTEEKAALLAESGCHACWYGLESASLKTREMVLGRHMSNQAIEKGVTLLRSRGIKTQSYNMMNIPGERIGDGFETLRLNKTLGNEFVVASLFQPFPGTELQERLIAEGKLKDPESIGGRDRVSYFSFSSFTQPDSEKFENLQKLFILGHRHKGLLPIIEKLVTLRKNPLFDILFLASFAIDYGRTHRLSAWEVAYFNVRHLWTTYFSRSRLTPDSKK